MGSKLPLRWFRDAASPKQYRFFLVAVIAFLLSMLATILSQIDSSMSEIEAMGEK